MRYLPFIIISLVLYTLFFYHNQQPDLLSAEQKNHTEEKIIPLDFEKVAKQEQQNIHTVSTVIKRVEEVAVIVTPTAAVTVVVAEQLIEDKKALAAANKNNFKQLQASITSTLASDSALLKSEFYERAFHLDLPSPPKKKKKPKKVKTTAKKTAPKAKKVTVKVITATKQDSVSSELLNMQQAPQTTTESNKPKRRFKKQVKANQSINDSGLQEAIAVSGNKPTYPQQAQKDQQQGIVTVKFIVTMRGNTKKYQLTHSSGHQILDNAVLAFIQKERFMPALKGIKKVTSEQQFSFEFVLK